MANEYGPTVEPGWIGGAKMPGSPDLAGNFMSAFQFQQTLNSKAQHMANELVLAQSRNDLAMERMRYTTENQLRDDSLSRERLVKMVEDKERDDKWRERKWYEVSAAKDALMGIDDAVGKSPGEEGYPEAFDEAARGVRDKLSLLPNQVFNNMRNRRMDSHNKNAASAWSQFHQEEKSLSEDLSKSAFGGKLETSYGPILDYNLLAPETKSTGLGGWFGFGEKKPTGKLLVPQPAGGELPVAVSELQRLKKRIQDVEERRKHLPYTVHIPEIGVYDEGKEPAPVDEALRENNKVYVTPNGQQNRWLKPPGAVKGQWVPP